MIREFSIRNLKAVIKVWNSSCSKGENELTRTQKNFPEALRVQISLRPLNFAIFNRSVKQPKKHKQ